MKRNASMRQLKEKRGGTKEGEERANRGSKEAGGGEERANENGSASICDKKHGQKGKNSEPKPCQKSIGGRESVRKVGKQMLPGKKVEKRGG